MLLSFAYLAFSALLRLLISGRGRTEGVEVIHAPSALHKQTPTPSRSSARSAPNVSTGYRSSAAAASRQCRPHRGLAPLPPDPTNAARRRAAEKSNAATDSAD